MFVDIQNTTKFRTISKSGGGRPSKLFTPSVVGFAVQLASSNWIETRIESMIELSLASQRELALALLLASSWRPSSSSTSSARVDNRLAREPVRSPSSPENIIFGQQLGIMLSSFQPVETVSWAPNLRKGSGKLFAVPSGVLLGTNAPSRIILCQQTTS